MIWAWLLQHLVEEAGASRSLLGVLAIRRGDQVVIHRPCFPLQPFFFFLGSREPEASVVSAFCFPLAAPSEKIAPTASSPEAKLVAMSSSWVVLVGVLRLSSCTSSLQVVPIDIW